MKIIDSTIFINGCALQREDQTGLFMIQEKKKNKFIISTGLLDGIYNGSFPEFDTKDKATMLLILAIADYNSRHEEV